MLYYKNAELASTYHVSVRTVRNWIESARQGKNDLTLHEHAGRHYVSNTSGNLALIEKLVAQGKKYRPHHTVKTVTPKPEFYKLFNDYQIRDIITSLEVHHEIPRQYNYFDSGAHSWDKYSWRLTEDDSPNLLTSTIELLGMSQSYIESIVRDYDVVNIVDVGVGNALPAKDFTDCIIRTGKAGRYIAIDLSPEMLKIAESNVKSWFGEDIAFEPHNLDMNHQRFNTILAQDQIHQDRRVINIILLFGGTACNQRFPSRAFDAIHDSMGINDIFIYADKLDTAKARNYFDFNSGEQKEALPSNHRLIFDLFNIDESMYEVERGFNEELRQRFIRVRLNTALDINLDFGTFSHNIELNKGESILLWRAWEVTLETVMGQLSGSYFSPHHIIIADNEEYLIATSRIKRDE